MSFHLSRPKSLKSQFNLALAILTLLIFSSGFIGTQTLKETVSISNQLGEERLNRLEKSQNLVQTALIIEHEAQLMLLASSVDDMRARYDRIIGDLNVLDKLVSELGQAGTGVSILKFQHAAQLFRGTVHVLATLHDQALNSGADTGQKQNLLENLHRINRNLVQQGAQLLSASQALSTEFSTAYRQSVRQLTKRSELRRHQVLIVLTVSLLLAWLVSRHFLGKLVISRLQQVSHYLRHAGGKTLLETSVPVSGDDEIGEMARAVEQYISERQQLAKVQQEAMQIARFVAVGQLAAGIAHEINTPSQYISNNLQFIEGVLKDLSNDTACANWQEDLQEATAAVRESREGIQRVSRIVLSMKEFSQPGNASKVEADIHRALENSLSVTHNQWKDIATIERHFDPELPHLLCDISKLNQVFLNLIVNATQAIEASGNLPGRITVSTGHDDTWVEIRIADTGTGIAREIRDRIFDPFFTTKPVGSGTGQGLAICHDIIVLKHGGTIDVSDGRQEGAEFIIRLPIAPHEASAQPAGDLTRDEMQPAAGPTVA